nr:recombinase RecA [uncultured Cardiobacterium sp.]
MPFTPAQEKSLLAEKEIGKTIIQRLIPIPENNLAVLVNILSAARRLASLISGIGITNGLDDIPALAEADVDDILAHGAYLTGSTCWRNSPQARAAITTAIAWAQRQKVRG